MKFANRILDFFNSGYRFADGSRLLPDGRDGKIYVRPDGRRVAFQCELWDAAAGAERCIYASTITGWMPPHEAEPFGEAERQEVIKKTVEFFEKAKTTYVVQ
jgi:hypothetical protein